MKKNYWILCLCLFGLLTAEEATAASWRLTSPDGTLRVEIETGGEALTYSLFHEGQCLLKESRVGILLDDGTEWGRGARVRSHKERAVEETVEAAHYRCATFTLAYKELDLRMKGDWGITFRAYDEGVAYRFYSTNRRPITIRNEEAAYCFDGDYPTYRAYSTARKGKDPYAMAFQNLYTRTTLSEADTSQVAFLPVTVDYGGGLKMTLLESDLEAYPGMFIRGGGGSRSLHGEFASYPAKMDYHPWRHMSYVTARADYIARVEKGRTFPWRIFAVTERDTEMPVNHLVYALASPNRIGDASWVKTGQVAWDWWNDWGIYHVPFRAGINMDTYKYYIDFASENGIPFVVLDEGWYDPKAGDMLSVIPALDLPALVAYAKERKVDLILWTVFNVLDEQLEAACERYAGMGIKGFKVDFMDRDDQTAVEMVYRIAEACARHHLTLDLHGIYKPTGLNRTYPNVINFESVFGMEEMKWSSVEKDMMQYDVEMPFIRMMAGPVDYTPGAMRNASKRDFKDIYYNPMSQGTRCHQLAAYIVHDSPLTMLADNPTIYRKEQACVDFITSIPTDGIDETRILQGELGKYIVTARRVGNNWFVGGMTNWDARTLTLDLSFLPAGDYQLTLFQDGVNAYKQAADYEKQVSSADTKTQLTIPLAPGGGFALSLIRK